MHLASGLILRKATRGPRPTYICVLVLTPALLFSSIRFDNSNGVLRAGARPQWMGKGPGRAALSQRLEF